MAPGAGTVLQQSVKAQATGKIERFELYDG